MYPKGISSFLSRHNMKHIIPFSIFIFFHNKKHSVDMGKSEIEQFLTHLAVDKKVSPTTQNQYTYIVAEMNRGRVTSPLDM